MTENTSRKTKGQMDAALDKILRKGFAVGASDVHLTVGKPPIFRVRGQLIDMPNINALSNKHLETFTKSITTPEMWDMFVKTKELDYSCFIEGVSRFRVNTFFQRGKVSMVFRIIPNDIPPLESLNMPTVLREIIKKKQGLILVTGPTGSGKSTTLAAMIAEMNHNTDRHIITLEDPIEYMHESDKSIIVQREVGVDTITFINGLRASLRQDPDVILVGELRDLETIQTAVTAAETGHLVLGTLHTNSATATITRMIDMFPPAQQTQIQEQIASTLEAVIAQQLLRTTDGKGRVAATEVMISNHAIRNQIKGNKLSQLKSTLQTSREYGMHTMDMDLDRLVQTGQVTPEVALPYYAEKPKDDDAATARKRR